MKMRTGHPARSAYETNDLTLRHRITYVDKNLRLMPKTAVDSPAVIDNRRVAAHS
jgi:hypothetical protein